MKTKLNRSLLENTSFTSDTLSPFSYLVHPLAKAGTYTLEVYANKRIIYANQIISSNEYQETGLNINLYLPALKQQRGSFLINGDHAYLLFYNSQSVSQNRVVIKDKAGKAVFDSDTPEKGDMFVLNLMKPGEYTLKSDSLKTSMKLDVQYPDIKKNKIADASNKISLDSKSIKAKQSQKLLPNQGVVIELGNGLQKFDIQYSKAFDKTLENSIRKELKTMARTSIKRSSINRIGKQPIKRFSVGK